MASRARRGASLHGTDRRRTEGESKGGQDERLRPVLTYIKGRHALSLDPRSFQAWNGLGNARSILRDYAGAVDAYERALRANPHSAVAWCNKAEALIRAGHTRAALDALNEATELDSHYARAWTLKADVYETLGNMQEAQKCRKRAKPWGLAN